MIKNSSNFSSPVNIFEKAEDFREAFDACFDKNKDYTYLDCQIEHYDRWAPNHRVLDEIYGKEQFLQACGCLGLHNGL